jgi:hypothetical protein
MRLDRTSLQTQHYGVVHLDIDIGETPTYSPIRHAARHLAVLGLTLGIGVAMLVMLGSWWSFAPRPADVVMTFIASSPRQTPHAITLESTDSPLSYLDDIFEHM